jgi:catechol 2,3-dioxygenase-like lactoylglutathione lyase family enzyme
MAGKSSETSGAPRIHHLALRTRSVDALAAFYRELLGLEEVRADRPRSVWLGLGDGAVLMIEARGDTEPVVPAGSLELFALRVSEERKREIRDAAMSRGSFDGETAYTVYLRDPDGRRVGVSTHPLAV